MSELFFTSVRPISYVPCFLQLRLLLVAWSSKSQRAYRLSSVAEKPNDGATRVRYKVVEFPLTIPSLRPHPDKPNPRQGIG